MFFMGNLLHVVTTLHKRTKRDYLKRMLDQKIECMRVARQYGKEYWDGDRRYGYGGYRYDGRWKAVAQALIELYGLTGSSKILDVGCGKGYLLYEFSQLLPGIHIWGGDISAYALENAHPEVKPHLRVLRAQDPYPFQDKEFDLVLSITTLHNLPVDEIKKALREIERVGKNKYIVVESYRTIPELFNLQCWALTCDSFFTEREWVWLFKEFGYTGDYEFIYFE
jgi:ubiquinone/menaquinone biosynthesis C-methylase UbiE